MGKLKTIIPIALSLIAVAVSIVSVVNDVATRRIAEDSYRVAQRSYVLADSSLHLEYNETVVISAKPLLLSSQMNELQVSKNERATELITLPNMIVTNTSRQPITITSISYESRCVKWKECDTLRLSGRWIRLGERVMELPTTLDPGRWLATADTVKIWVPYSLDYLERWLFKSMPDSSMPPDYELDALLHSPGFSRNVELIGSTCDRLRLSVTTARDSNFFIDHIWNK